MTLFNHGIRGAAGILALLIVLPAGAQENLDRGKTAAQLFASDCAICHKTPQGLAKNAGLFGLDSFLRQHYTASRESAAALSKYLEAQGDAPPAPAQRAKRSTKRSTKGADKKPTDAKADDAKSEETKKDAKPTEAKAEPKPETKAESKAEPKPKADAKPAAADKPAKSD